MENQDFCDYTEEYCLYGKLNKQVLHTAYKGSTTDTAVTTIDKNNNIKVDVIVYSSPIRKMVAGYSIDGTLRSNDPINKLDVVNKQYAEEHFITKTDTPNVVFGNDENGDKVEIPVTTSATPNTVVKRDNNAFTQVNTPDGLSGGPWATNKSWVLWAINEKQQDVSDDIEDLRNRMLVVENSVRWKNQLNGLERSIWDNTKYNIFRTNNTDGE